MKKSLIIFFAVLLLLVGCSTKISTDINTYQAPEEPEVNEEIEAENDNEEMMGQKEAEPFNGSNEETNEGEQSAEEPAEEILNEPEEITAEEPAVKEQPEEEPVAEEQTDENNEKGDALKINGLVENELKLTVEELKKMSDIIFEADFYSLNSFGTTGYTHFKGVKLWDLLETKALINPEASKITVSAQDGYSMEFTIEQVQMEYMDETNPDNKYPMIIAWEENSEEYTADEGNPYKLVVGQKEPGDVNKPQWVSNIDVILIE